MEEIVMYVFTFVGGIKGFVADNNSVTKWCLNRPEQAKNTNALKQMAYVTSSADIYKALRPSQIIKSEDKVSRLVQILENDYINPFSVTLEATKLFNLSSGVAVEDDLADQILNIIDIGKSLAETFRNERLIQHNISFHEPIKRTSIAIFKHILKSAVVRKDNQSMTLQVNRNIIGALLSYSTKSGTAIDFERALKFPLSAVPLSTANGDGSRRETSKSKVMDFINPKGNENSLQAPSENVSIFFINFIALFRTLTVRPLLVESSVIVIFYVIFLMCYAVIINYFGKKIFFQLRENRR